MFTSVYTKRGDVSSYGFRMGYVDSRDRTTASGREYRVILQYNGSTYDVDAFYTDVPREYDTYPSGMRILRGWAQFDHLADARAFYRWARSTAITTSSVEVRAADIMGAFGPHEA